MSRSTLGIRRLGAALIHDALAFDKPHVEGNPVKSHVLLDLLGARLLEPLGDASLTLALV